MNDSSAPQPLDPREECLIRIWVLKYLMAGDMESVEFLVQLEARASDIAWNSPDFIESSKLMRGEAPLPESDRGDMVLTLASMICRQLEDIASLRQAHVEALAAATVLLEQSRVAAETTARANKNCSDALDFVAAAIPIFEKMRDQLEMLGADVASYQLPSYPSSDEPPRTDVP